MKNQWGLLIATLMLLAGCWTSSCALANEAPKVVVSIAPFHALVSAVMKDIGEPKLLLKGNASPHHYNLRPSEIKTLQEAEVIFWGGPLLETFLVKPLKTLTPATLVVAFDKTPGLTLLGMRRSPFFPVHTHESQETGEHDHSHHQQNTDLHFWLDPNNAKRMIDHIAEQLSRRDPPHKSQYFENAKQFKKQLEATDQKIQQKLQSVRHQPFITFHDAYQYLERHYGLKGVGSISLHPEVPLSVERLQTIRQTVQKTGAVCVFSEPQFKSNIVKAIAEEAEIKTAELDPIGKPSPVPGAGYLNLLNDLSTAMMGCLQVQPSQ